jgi:hypothetical protein
VPFEGLIYARSGVAPTPTLCSFWPCGLPVALGGPRSALGKARQRLSFDEGIGDAEGLRQRWQAAKVRGAPGGASEVAHNEFVRVEVLDQLAVEQTGVALQEFLKAVRAPALQMDSDEVQPRTRHRLVVLLFGSVRSCDVADRRHHDLARFFARIRAQVAPGQLEVLAMAEAIPCVEDLMKDLEITCPDEPTVVRTASPRKAAMEAVASQPTKQSDGLGPLKYSRPHRWASHCADRAKGRD